MSKMGGRQATLILATIAAAGGLACAAGSSGVDAHRRLQAATCSSYFEVTAAANALEAACCPPGSSFAVSACQMTPEMECTRACSTPFLDFVNGPCLATVNLSPQEQTNFETFAAKCDRKNKCPRSQLGGRLAAVRGAWACPAPTCCG